jgi:glycine hydroxymethyltransferase
MTGSATEELVATGLARLAEEDPQLAGVLEREAARQAETLSLVASSSVVDPSVLVCQSSVAVNVTAEGYPGHRYHAGCAVVDDIESLAVERAKAAFGARYANVQPHTASTANYTVLSALMRPGDTMLGMELNQGGHLSHGSPAAYSGQYFRAVGYGLDEAGVIDYAEVARLAAEHRPVVIVCGATAYPRLVDFARFRRIADSVGAHLLADISHTAGLVAAGLHPSPIEHAHITTTCTHKQLFGPRGGLILSGADADGPAPRGRGTLADFLQRAIFPFSQGAPVLNAIAAKARALAMVTTPEFRALAGRIRDDAGELARQLDRRGHTIVSGGTDNHIVLVDLGADGMTGLVAERALEECRITVNKNRVPHDRRPALVTSGLRLGTNCLARRGLAPADMAVCADLVDRVLRAVHPTGDRTYELSTAVRDEVRFEVGRLCRAFPLPGYPAAAGWSAGLTEGGTPPRPAALSAS